MELEEKIATSELTDTGSAVIQALAYSSVFSYPLRKDEILAKMPMLVPDGVCLDRELERLVEMNIVFRQDELYYLSEPADHVASRMDRNLRARKYMRTARLMSRFIGSFPFVRGVFLSGSISKECMAEDGDIDYFIITEPGRLWICRTLLIAFKKIFLFNSYKFFCLNYFVDSDHLEIQDRNIYTAHEITTLIPTYGRSICCDFLQANQWTNDFLPNRNATNNEDVPETRIRGLKWMIEILLSPSYGRAFERYCQKISQRYWKQKFHHLDDLQLTEINDSSATHSAHHPENFKKKVLSKYQSVLKDLEFKYDVRFS